MIVILTGIGVFLAMILLLTGAIILVENALIPKGDVRIVVNDEDDAPLLAERGGTLLSELVSNDILIPSACGGAGSCGVCKVQVLEGGGDILPTEETFITRKMAREHYRLACQVKVRENMRIHVPEEVFHTKKWECEVVSNESVATFIKEFVVKLPEGETLNFEPGGYVQIEVPHYNIDFGKDIDIPPEYRDDWEKMGLFNLHAKNIEEVSRAYSMANHPAEGNIVMLNIRIATPPWDRKKKRFMHVPPGVSSSYIFSRKPGDKVTISGPYGEFFINDSAREMVYIGGGAGMAPMRSHLMHLFKTAKTGRKVSFWYGARSKREIFYEDHFREIEKAFPNFSVNIGLSDPLPEDNWTGPTGFIHQVLYDEYLSKHSAPEDIEYYLCGPPMMIAAVNDMLYTLGVEKEMIRYDEF